MYKVGNWTVAVVTAGFNVKDRKVIFCHSAEDFDSLLFQDHWARGAEAGEYELTGIHQQRTKEPGPACSPDDYKSQDSLLPHWLSGGQSDSEGK